MICFRNLHHFPEKWSASVQNIETEKSESCQQTRSVFVQTSQPSTRNTATKLEQEHHSLDAMPGEKKQGEPEARFNIYIASDVVPVGGMLHHGRQACRKKAIALFRIIPIDSIK
jgi:hypothetical protein